MTSTMAHPEAFGIATIASDLKSAREFYTQLYPYEVKEDAFGGIPFFSIIKNRETVVSVFEKIPGNPILGTIPVIKVDSVRDYVIRLQAMGASVIIPPAICACTDSLFALCADREGNQFIVKEPTAA